MKDNSEDEEEVFDDVIDDLDLEEIDN